MKEKHDIVFSYNSSIIKNKKLRFNKTTVTVLEIIKNVADESGLDYKIQGNKVIFFSKKQKFVINGSVKDAETGITLPDANIAVKDYNYNTITGADGNYKIILDPGYYTIVFSFIGFKTEKKEIELNSNLEINISLDVEINSLEEVKVTKQRNFWGNMNIGRNMSSIDSKKIELLNTNNAADILQARIAGVWSSQTSGAPGDHQKILVRGLSSLYSCSDPLYIIDGVAVPYR